MLAQIGATIAEVQRVPVGELSRIEPRWEHFIAGRSRAAARGTRVSACRKNFWMGWTNLCAMPRR